MPPIPDLHTQEKGLVTWLSSSQIALEDLSVRAWEMQAFQPGVQTSLRRCTQQTEYRHKVHCRWGVFIITFADENIARTNTKNNYSQQIILRQYHWIERLATVNGSDRSQTRRWFHRRFSWWPRLFCHTHRQGMSMRTDAKAEVNSGASNRASNRALIAQLVEHRVVMREVVSSTPAGPTLRVLK